MDQHLLGPDKLDTSWTGPSGPVLFCAPPASEWWLFTTHLPYRPTVNNHRGVTLIEVVVALLVLTVGAIALAGLAATVARMVDSGARATRLAALIGERVEILQGSACNGPTQGRERRDRFELRWTVAPDGGGRRLTVWATSSTTRIPRAITITRFVDCPV